MTEQQNLQARLARFDTSSIDSKNPWAGNSVPEREILAQTLTRHFIASGGPYVLSISSAWGTGKSDFLERWDKWLQLISATPKPLCFRFNAWEHDFADDPFLAFAVALNKFIKDNPPSEWESFKTHATDFVRSLLKIGKDYIFAFGKHAAQHGVAAVAKAQGADEDTANMLGGAATGTIEVADEQAQLLLDRLQNENNSRGNVKETLEAFGLAVKNEFGAPLVIMVDELDRCKPSFAIALLEAIKHLFCVPGIVFVLAIETKQLSNCISKTYGLDDIGARSYLHKFVDMDIALPPMDMHNFLCNKLQTDSFPCGLPTNQLTLEFIDGFPSLIPSKPDFLLSEWVAAVIHDILPSSREALQVLNQLSVLSFRQDMDFISLLACSYALALRVKNHISIEESIDKTLSYIELVELQNLKPEASRIFQYRNLFSGLVQSRRFNANADKQYAWETLFAPNKKEKPYYLLRTGETLWSGFQNIYEFGHLALYTREEKKFSWRIPCGDAWRAYLVSSLYFMEQPEEA